MSKKILIGVLVVLIAAILAIISINRNSTSKMVQDIHIGIVLPLTGKAATYGERSLQGIQLAIDVSNGTSNTNGNLRIIVEDSQSQASRAVTSFTKLVNIDKVPVVVGLLTSDEALACAPLAMRHKVILFTPGATSKELKEAGSYIFRNRESVELQTAVIAEACVKRKSWSYSSRYYSIQRGKNRLSF
jgi:branched-chain amino acid transport system substrate-binding protein